MIAVKLQQISIPPGQYIVLKTINEIDLTSKTKINAYQSLKVPEIWIYNQNKLEIYCLQNEQYMLCENSIIFPDFPIQEAMMRFLKTSKTIGTTQTLKQFRHWIKSVIN